VFSGADLPGNQRVIQDELPDDRRVFLSTEFASRSQRRIGLSAVLISAMFFSSCRSRRGHSSASKLSSRSIVSARLPDHYRLIDLKYDASAAAVSGQNLKIAAFF